MPTRKPMGGSNSLRSKELSSQIFPLLPVISDIPVLPVLLVVLVVILNLQIDINVEGR
jgi:hypothetical protein